MNNYYRNERRSMSLWDLLFLVGMWAGACVVIGVAARIGWMFVSFGWGLVP